MNSIPADQPVPTDYDKPFPVPDEFSQPFFDATLRGELLLQHCGACGQWIWPTRFRCVECFSDDLHWEASSGRGTIYSYTIVHQLVHPGFADELPYNVISVDLDEGVRMISHLVDDVEPTIDRRVEVEFRRVSDDLALPMFHLAEDSA